jgi:L-aspartate oxidase
MVSTPDSLAVRDLDVLVLGSGVAGLSAVVRLAEDSGMRVGVLTKAELSQSATRWAQGGVAAVLGGDEDSTDLHLADTLAAGAGLCDQDAVRVLVDEGPIRVRELIALGAVFDREASGGLALAREGGHSTARVVHAGGAATGAEVERALVDAVERTAAAVLEQWFALDLIVEAGRCVGVVAINPAGRRQEIRARHVVLATGGAGQLYAVTTNPPEATGDGIAMALRAGVPVGDLEFFQFHPTALHHPAMPRPLLSEALRGHGALLRDAAGDRFVDELAARDVVSRAMADTMARQGVEHLWLDATGLANFSRRFPTLNASLSAIGLDPGRDWLPIAPAAHYLSGGVLTDLDGATALPGLWAAGETACTGVHGANRLASNSLLEGMVFGARLSEAIESGRGAAEATGVLAVLSEGASEDPEVIPWLFVEGNPPGSAVHQSAPEQHLGDRPDLQKERAALQRAMTEGAGVLRDPTSLSGAHRVVEEISTRVEIGFDAKGSAGAEARNRGELVNLATVAEALLRAASARTETRGAHARRDFPETDPAWRCRLVHGHLAPGNRTQPPDGARGDTP